MSLIAVSLIFDRFPSHECAEAFRVAVKEKFKLDGQIFDTVTAAQKHDPFPFQLEPPIVHIDRHDDIDVEERASPRSVGRSLALEGAPMNQQGYLNERECLDGETSVYPGHPLTVAYLIIHLYPSLACATRKSDRSDYMHALSNGAVPGAGGNVYSALRFLQAVVRGEQSMQAAIDSANSNWEHCDGQADGGRGYAKSEADRERFIKRWRHGQAQADRILPRLTEKLLFWPATA